MNISDLKKNWDAFGEQDPLWAILTDPSKRDGKWDPVEFFATGEREIAAVVEYLAAKNIAVGHGRALDFGCGVGRLTQALCQHFDEAYGIDISSSMIERGKQFNRFGERCIYQMNPKDDLSLFQDNFFDFIYSNIVLQHMKPEYSAAYVKEFMRILKPEGVAVFQLPSEQGKPEGGEALPREAFRAKISIEPKVLRIGAGRSNRLAVRVKNVSSVSWPDMNKSRFPLRLGNHWRSLTGKLILQDDGRIEIPGSLGPGEQVELELEILAPLRPGFYILELDLVQEVYAWFKDKGSRTTLIPVVVSGAKQSVPAQAQSSEQAGKSSFVPVMELHGILKEKVVKLIEEQGGNVVDIRSDHSLGSWPSYVYTVMKNTNQ